MKHFEEVCNQKPEELVFENLKHQYKLWKYWLSLETKNFKSDINDREGDVSSVLEIFKHFTLQGDFTTATIFSIINGHLKTADSNWAIETTKSLREALLVSRILSVL